jgi:hypothetical protein
MTSPLIHIRINYETMIVRILVERLGQGTTTLSEEKSDLYRTREHTFPLLEAHRETEILEIYSHVIK